MFLNKDKEHHAQRLSSFFLERCRCGTPYSALCSGGCGDGCGPNSCSPDSALNQAHQRGKSCPLRDSRRSSSSSGGNGKRGREELPPEAGEIQGQFTESQRPAWLNHMSESMLVLQLPSDFVKLFNSYLAMASYKYGPFAADRKRRRGESEAQKQRSGGSSGVQQLVAAEEVVIEVSLSSPGLSS